MSPIKLSRRACQTPASPIRRLAYLAKEAEAQGRGVFYLNIGQPDLESPAAFFEGVSGFSSDVLAYDYSEGNSALRSIWTKMMNRSLSLELTRNQILITTGASEALIFTFMTCCDPDDEVLIFDPTYANYIGFAAISGVKLISILTLMEDNFKLPDVDEIASKITSRTRAVLLCSPNNPTGTAYSREELERLIAVCDEHNLFLVVDETYREFVYDGIRPISVLQVAPGNERVIVIDSLSKRYSLCGARIGCLITSNEEVLAKTLNLAQARLASPTIEQAAAAYMLNRLPADFIRDVSFEYQRRRDALHLALKSVDGVVAQKPQGAFYSIVRLPVDSAENFASFLLREVEVDGATAFVAPAKGFYMSDARGENKIRIAYVLNSEHITKAVEVIRQGLAAYQGKR